MAAEKSTLIKRKKFLDVSIPIIGTNVELIGENIQELNNRTVKLDLTRHLRGKSIEAVFRIKVENSKASANPKKITLMPYFIRRMIRKRISYVEDSFEAKTQESLVRIKPFLITRKRVSRAVRKTLRNLTKNWLEDYLADKTDDEVFNNLLSNQMQRPLSLKLKKTYPLSLCEIRVFEVIRPLEASEVPKIEKKKEPEPTEQSESKEIGEGLDQMAEIEEELKKQKVKEAEEEIKKTQDKAVKKEGNEKEIEASKNLGALGTEEPKKEKKVAKKKVKKEE